MFEFYFARMLARAVVFIFATYELVVNPDNLDFVVNFGLGKGFTLMNVLWVYIMIGLVLEFFPRTNIHIGGEKQYKRNYVPTGKTVEQIKRQIENANKGAYIVLLVWVLGNLIIGILYKKGILITRPILLWISMFYFLSDLICVIFFCPFQYFMMKNRCCTTCRIFKWDSLMATTPFIFAEGRFAASLVLVSAILGLLWEYRYKKFPERFFEQTNEVLKCKNCTTHMCRIKAQKFHPPKSRVFNIESRVEKTQKN